MSGASDAIPVSVALSAGGLAVLNPCSFPLLPVFLSASVAGEGVGRVGGRFAQGLVVGGAVAAGFVAVFATLALPISYGARFASDAVPWTGFGLGIVLVVVGAFTWLGRNPTLRLRRSSGRSRRGVRAMLVYGAGYGLASLGCSLPLFLSLIGATLSTGPSLVAFGAYVAGVTLVLIALALAAAFVHDGLARATRRVLPYMHRISGLLLVIVGGYVAYYWGRTEWGSRATLADDPLVGTMTRVTARLQTLAERHDTTLLLAAASIVALAAFATFVGRIRRRAEPAPRRRAIRDAGE